MLPHVSDDDIRRMAREAERETNLLPTLFQQPSGTRFRLATIRLGVVPLSDLTADELAWYLGVVVLGRVR